MTPDDGRRSAQYGGPRGPLSVPDYNNDSTRPGPDTHIDIYRFPKKTLGNQYGRQNLNTTLSGGYADRKRFDDGADSDGEQTPQQWAGRRRQYGNN